MFITPLASNNFQGKPQLKTTLFSLPGKNGAVQFRVTGELCQKATAVKYNLSDIEKFYENKNGLSDDRLAVIINEAQKYLKEGVDFLFEFIQAQKSQGIHK